MNERETDGMQGSAEGFSEAQGGQAEQGGFEVDELKLQMVRDRLRAEQSFGAGLGAGVAAALVGAILWAVITVATGYQIGFMAIGVGFLVGLAVRYFGKGVDTSFAVVGAVLSLAGCVFGNVLSIYGFASRELGIPLDEVFGTLEFSLLIEILKNTFNPIDLLFYGIAVYEGWQLSQRRLTPEELEQLLAETG